MRPNTRDKNTTYNYKGTTRRSEKGQEQEEGANYVHTRFHTFSSHTYKLPLGRLSFPGMQIAASCWRSC